MTENQSERRRDRQIIKGQTGGGPLLRRAWRRRSQPSIELPQFLSHSKSPSPDGKMRTTATTILLIAAIPMIVDSLTCFTCQTVTNNAILVNLTDKMFNRSSLPITADCANNISTGTLTPCADKCLIAITQSTDENFAIRGCASTVFKPAQLAALQLSTSNISYLNNSCFTSQPDSMYEMAPALASVCFCSTDSCNSASWDTIMPRADGNNDATTLHIVTGVLTLIACFIATSYY